MKKTNKGGLGNDKNSTREYPKGQQFPRRSSSELKPAQVRDTPFLAANEVERYKSLKSRCKDIEGSLIGEPAKEKPPGSSKKIPTIWTVYNGWVRDENNQPRFALEALNAQAQKEMFSNPPVERKYEGLCNILDVMEDTLAFADNPEQPASVRHDALSLFHYLDNLLYCGLAGVDFITIATMAFTCGVVATRLRQPEVMKAAHEGDKAHRGRQKAGKNRAQPDVWMERLQTFQSLKMKSNGDKWEYGTVTSICREIARLELKAEDRLTEPKKCSLAETIEKQLRAKYPDEFPLSQRNSPKESSKRT